MIVCNSIVDKEYDNVPIDFLEEENFTVSYDLKNNCWTSFHDYFPDYSFNLRNGKVLQFKDKKLYALNEGEAGNFFGFLYPCYITPVYSTGIRTENNDAQPREFILKSAQWHTDIEHNGIRVLNETWSSISLHNSYQGTRDKLLVPFKDDCSFLDQFGKANTRKIGSTWAYNYAFNEKDTKLKRTWEENLDDFNIINVENKDCNWEELVRSKLLDTYIIVRLVYNNIGNKKLFFYNLSLHIDIRL